MLELHADSGGVRISILIINYTPLFPRAPSRLTLVHTHLTPNLPVYAVSDSVLGVYGVCSGVRVCMVYSVHGRHASLV